VGRNGLKKLLGADDSLDVFGVHGVGGIVGALLTGVFIPKNSLPRGGDHAEKRVSASQAASTVARHFPAPCTLCTLCTP
jgi:ammonia channel protein AmtB